MLVERYPLGRDTTSPSYLKMTSTDFTAYNAAMMASWSKSCGAYWPCAGAAALRAQSATTRRQLRAVAPHSR